MNNEPSNLQIVLMALATAAVVYVVLWLTMALF